MIVYDLNSGHREYPGYDEIEDRRGGGRGRSRRSDGTYMGYGGGIYDHYGMHEKMKEMEERENELEERERRLEDFFQYQARCDFNVSGFYFNSYCFILNLINS